MPQFPVWNEPWDGNKTSMEKAKIKSENKEGPFMFSFGLPEGFWLKPTRKCQLNYAPHNITQEAKDKCDIT